MKVEGYFTFFPFFQIYKIQFKYFRHLKFKFTSNNKVNDAKEDLIFKLGCSFCGHGVKCQRKSGWLIGAKAILTVILFLALNLLTSCIKWDQNLLQ